MQVNEGVKKTIIVPSAQRRETCIMQSKAETHVLHFHAVSDAAVCRDS